MELGVHGLTIAYGRAVAVRDVSLGLSSGEVVALIGTNGAGKTSILNAIIGCGRGKRSGTVELDGVAISGWPTRRIVENGVCLCPEGRELFPDLSVGENLLLGGYVLQPKKLKDQLLQVEELFPKLREKRGQIAGTLSGGEQQMVALGRALMSGPKILLLDEPTLGLAPKIVEEVMGYIDVLRKRGLGVLLVEQNAHQALTVSDRSYVIERGAIVFEGKSDLLLGNEELSKAFLG